MAPETTITAYPPALSTAGTAIFEFSATEPGSVFECDLDETGFGACTSPASYTDLPEGAHAFSVRAKDPAGNMEETPATYAWTIDLSKTITASAGPGGAISPEGATTVPYNGSQTYVITPGPGYSVYDVLVDGDSVGAVTSHTFENVTTDHTISASFAQFTYTITATAGPNGTITPGTGSVPYGGTVFYAIAPALGYRVDDVLVDTVSVGRVDSYTFTSVTADHSISVTFALDTVQLFEPDSVSPGQGAVLSTTIVGYTLTQDITSGGVTFERTGGSADDAVHTYAFTEAELTAGAHSIDTGFPLVNGAIYTVTYLASDGTNTVEELANNVTYDPAAVVVIESPLSNTTVNTAKVSYTLSETVVSGTITIERTGGTADGLAPYTYTLSGTELAVGSHTVDTKAALVTGALYSFTINGVTDQTGNAANEVSSTNVGYDSQAVTIMNTSPGRKAIITTATAGYTLSEQAQTGKITFTRSAGAADSGSPHSYTLTGPELEAVSHTITTGFSLVNGAFYTVSFEAVDSAGNPATTVSNALVFFDGNYGVGPVGNVANEDGLNVVNDADVAKLTALIGARAGDANWDPSCDLNRDNVIDRKDLLILKQHYGL
jgi:uncharacterized protein (DUF779 family)